MSDNTNHSISPRDLEHRLTVLEQRLGLFSALALLLAAMVAAIAAAVIVVEVAGG